MGLLIISCHRRAFDYRLTRAVGRRRAGPRAFLGIVVLLMLSTSANAAPESEPHLGPEAFVDGVAQPRFIGQILEIIPGVQVGPVRLGMSAYDAAGVALAFEQASGCQIDLLIRDGLVVAAGTRFGGCLHVSRSHTAGNMAGTPESPALHWDPVVDGPASDFIAAFGDPVAVRLQSNRLALIWPQGLVAHVSGIHDGDGNVTYLAVVAPGSHSVPAIGYLRISLKIGGSGSLELALSRSASCGRFPPPILFSRTL